MIRRPNGHGFAPFPILLGAVVNGRYDSGRRVPPAGAGCHGPFDSGWLRYLGGLFARARRPRQVLRAQRTRSGFVGQPSPTFPTQWDMSFPSPPSPTCPGTYLRNQFAPASQGAGLWRQLFRRLRKWLRRLLLLVLVIAVAQSLTVAGVVYFTVNHGQISSTRFMGIDREWTRNPTSYRPLGPQSGRPLDPRAVQELRDQLSQVAYEWVSIDNVSRQALEVLVSREDQELVTREWMPFDVSEFVGRARAWLSDSKDKDPSGSTIPQQLAKNLYTNGERSAWRKLWEADAALMMSLTTSNRRILEVYANIIEFGPGVYGVCAASWYYFNKPPGQLTNGDAATLVGLMPSPKTNKIDPTHGNVQFARKYVGRYLNSLHQLPTAQLDELFAVDPRADQPSCTTPPPSLAARLQATQTPQGYPRYADDQSYWPRMTRQYARGTLPSQVRSSLDTETRAELARLAPYTPGAQRSRRSS
jgi:membrane peptidoglycan carboxypeptidase